METRVTDWISFGHHGYSHYRIWFKKTVNGFYARHEWLRGDGSMRTDEWEPSVRKDFPKYICL